MLWLCRIRGNRALDRDLRRRGVTLGQLLCMISWSEITHGNEKFDKTHFASDFPIGRLGGHDSIK